MNDNPPSRANATAIVSFETDCMHAETNGMFIDSGESSPFLNLHRGVRNVTFEGTQFSDEYDGTRRYSENVCEGSL